MRTCYLVTYDICDPKRLAKVYKTMRGFGDHLQDSVFRCELSEIEKVKLLAALDPLLHHREDQVLLVDVGPADGRSQTAFSALGLPYTHSERHAVVI
ncbi:MAG: CRISPR-associated endonuclease Cas2 [Myxococcota bacterium]|jgi:CRISPR-associated protein Cas2|nr:CRISPR-associated endonuclease Cas2 [Myxococcota bacterium]